MVKEKKRNEELEEIYMMHNQVKWEDLVVWDNSQIKSPPPKHMELLYFAGLFIFVADWLRETRLFLKGNTVIYFSSHNQLTKLLILIGINFEETKHIFSVEDLYLEH